MARIPFLKTRSTEAERATASSRLSLALSSFADWLYQSPLDHVRKTRSQSWRSAEAFAFGLAACALIGVLTFLLICEGQAWLKDEAVVPLAPNAWKRWVEPPLVGEMVLPNSDFQALWQSKQNRFPKGSLQAEVFWLGQKLSPEELAPARTANAHYLVLGWVRGQYQLFINGSKLHEGRRDDHEPIAVTFPSEWLSSKDGLSIAIRIDPEPGVDRPDIFAKPSTEKLTTAEGARAYLTAVAFYKKTRPFTLVFLNLAFAFLFFFIWITGRESRETLYVSFFLLVSAALQLRLTDVYLGRFSPGIDYHLDFILRSAEGCAGLLMGLAFARLRGEFFRFIPPVWALTSVIFIAISPDAVALRDGAFWMEQNLLAFCFYIGTVACVLQAWRLRERGTGLSIRRRRLLLFAAGLTMIGLIYSTQLSLGSILVRTFVWRFGHLGILVVMGGIAMRELTEQRRLFQRSPISKYHRRSPLPDRLEGALLCLDLKNSEALSRSSASKGEAGSILIALTTQLWTAASAHNGVVVQTDGDQLKIFFEFFESGTGSSTGSGTGSDTGSERLPNAGFAPLTTVFNAVDAMHVALLQMAQQLSEQGLLNSTNGVEIQSLHFRAGLAWGEIRPIWQVSGNDRVATWIEAGHSIPFVESARLMELERQISPPSPDQSTQVILTDAFAEKLAKKYPSFPTLEKRTGLKAKHDLFYDVAVYRPQAKAGDKLGKPESLASVHHPNFPKRA